MSDPPNQLREFDSKIGAQSAVGRYLIPEGLDWVSAARRRRGTQCRRSAASAQLWLCECGEIGDSQRCFDARYLRDRVFEPMLA